MISVDIFAQPYYIYNNRTPRTSPRKCDVTQGRHYFMAELKPLITYKQQVEKLHGKGCQVSDISFYEQVLSQINYYRLSATKKSYKVVKFGG